METNKYYITKYWQSQGIEEVEGIEYPPGDRHSYAFLATERQLDDARTAKVSYYDGEYHKTKEDAIAHVEKLRQKKVAALEKQLKKMKELVVADLVKEGIIWR